MRPYTVKEIFFSLQGEGHRKGSPNVFIRFAGCNMACNLAEHGFDCDTDFKNGSKLGSEEIADIAYEMWCDKAGRHDESLRWVIVTGGEPTLQLDSQLINALHWRYFRIAIETNGTREIPMGIDYVACCPKSPKWSDVVLRKANEVRQVVSAQCLPHDYQIEAEHYFLSPAFDPETNEPLPGAVSSCIDLCLRYPRYRLSLQDHKFWGVR